MPTGFTSDIYEDKDVSFEDFTMNCARAFGALASLRDEPDAEIPEEFTVASYYPKKIVEAEEELEKLKQMTDEEIAVVVQKEYIKQKEYFTKELENRKALRERYEEMLRKVEAWQVPTKDHVSLKNFMIEQLNTSIDGDCSTRYYTSVLNDLRVQSVEEYRINSEEKLKKDLEFYTKYINEEKERVENKNKWIKNLRESMYTK